MQTTDCCVVCAKQPKDTQDGRVGNDDEEGEKLYSKIMCAYARALLVLIQAWDQQTAVAMC